MRRIVRCSEKEGIVEETIKITIELIKYRRKKL